MGNGSDEVLAHAFMALLKKPAPLLFPDITYSFYPVYCRLYGIDYRRVPLRDDFSIEVDDYAQPNGGVRNEDCRLTVMRIASHTGSTPCASRTGRNSGTAM